MCNYLSKRIKLRTKVRVLKIRFILNCVAQRLIKIELNMTQPWDRIKGDGMDRGILQSVVEVWWAMDLGIGEETGNEKKKKWSEYLDVEILFVTLCTQYSIVKGKIHSKNYLKIPTIFIYSSRYHCVERTLPTLNKS